MSKSGDRSAGPGASHEEVQALLPWYANGTLDEAEHAWVEEHLAECAGCRAEAEECGALGATVRAAETMAPAPHPVELARLLARIDATEELGRGGFRPWRWLRATLGGTPPLVRWALAAQLALLLGAGALAGWGRPAPSPAGFRTLSDAPAAAAAEAQLRVPYLRVMFREQASEAEIRGLLLPLEAQIVGGPSPLGVYTLSLPTGADRDPLPVVLAHLKGHSEVRFVEAVDPAPAAGER